MDDLRARASALYEAFFNSLPKPRYCWCHPDPGERVMFAVDERAPVGQKFPDGKKYRRVGGIRGSQLLSIVSTSATDAEAIDRIRMLVMEGKDTTMMGAAQPSRMTDVEVEDRIQKRVTEELMKHLNLIAKTHQPVAVQKPKKAKAKKADDDSSYAIWVERAAEANLGEPKRHPSDETKVDGRWLRHVKPTWDAFVATRAQA